MARVEVVEVAGEFSLRGGILDVFPPDATEPVRIEFFGDEVESIRPFDAETQRSLDRWDSVTLTVPPALRRRRPGRASATSPTPSPRAPGSPWSSRPTCARRAGTISAGSTTRAGLYSVESTFARLIKRPSITLSTLAADSLETTCHLRIESVERFSGELAKVKAELDGAAAGDRVLIACHNAAEVERLGEVFADTAIAQTGRLHLTVGRIRAGLPHDRRRRPWSSATTSCSPAPTSAARRPGGGTRAGRSTASSTSTRATWSSTSTTASPATAACSWSTRRPSTPRRRSLLEFAEGTKLYRADRQDRPGAEVRRRRQGGPAALEDRLVGLGEAEEAGGRGGRRPRRRADRHPGRAGQPAGDRLPGRGQPLDGRVRGGLPLPGDARPALRDRRDQGATWPSRGRWTA